MINEIFNLQLSFRVSFFLVLFGCDARPTRRLDSLLKIVINNGEWRWNEE